MDFSFYIPFFLCFKCLQAVTKEGYLMKQKWKFHQRWRRRYFRLKGHKLYYSKDADEVCAQDFIQKISNLYQFLGFFHNFFRFCFLFLGIFTLCLQFTRYWKTMRALCLFCRAYQMFKKRIWESKIARLYTFM